MTPKEKAENLLRKMLSKNPNIQDGLSRIDTIQAKLCALITVDEILYLLINVYEFDEFDNGKVEYWKEVKKEIEKL